MGGRISRKRIPGRARDGRNLGEVVKTQGGGAVDRFPGRAGPREKDFCGRGAGKGPSYISAIEFSKCP